MQGKPPGDGPSYSAFVSYSHRDTAFAERLHKYLETYRVPAALVGRATRIGTVPAKLFPVFRDRDELPTASDLGDNIRQALRNSRFLVVVCSPHAAASRWVNQEIREFKAMGRESNVLSVVIAGEPNASDRPETGLTECFPSALRFRVDRDGNETSDRVEPIAADARSEGDGQAAARLKLVAALIGVGYSELYDRERVRRQRRRRMQAVAASLLVALIALVWWLGEQGKQRALDAAMCTRLLEHAQDAAGGGDSREAALYFAELNRLCPSVANQQAAMRHMELISAPRSTVALDQPAVWVAASENGSRFLAMGSRGLVRVYDAISLRVVSEYQASSADADGRAYFSPEGDLVLVVAGDEARTFATETGEPVGKAVSRWFFGGVRSDPVLDPTGTLIAIKSHNEPRLVQLFDARSGEPTGDAIQLDTQELRFAYLWDDDRIPRFSRDRSACIEQSDNCALRVVDAASRKAAGPLLRGQSCITSAVVHPNGNAIITNGGQAHSLQVWELDSARPLHTTPPLIELDSAVRLSLDGKLVLSVGANAALLWDERLSPMSVLPLTAELTAMCVSGDGNSIFTAAKDGTIDLWAVSKLQLDLSQHASPPWNGLKGSWVAQSGEWGIAHLKAPSDWQAAGTLVRFGTGDGNVRWSVDAPSGRVLGAVFSRDASRVAIVARVKDDTNPEPESPPVPPRPVPEASVHTHDNPRRLVGGTQPREAFTIRVLDANSGSVVIDSFKVRIEHFAAAPPVLAWTKDSGRMCVVANHLDYDRVAEASVEWITIDMLDMATGQKVRASQKVERFDEVTSAVISPDGDLLVGSYGGVSRLSLLADNAIVEPVIDIREVKALEISPDSTKVFVASRSVGQLFTSTALKAVGPPLLREEGYTSDDSVARFAPDGQTLLWRTTKGGTQLVNALTGERIGSEFEFGAEYFGSPTRIARWNGGREVSSDISLLLRPRDPADLAKQVRTRTRLELGSDGLAKLAGIR